MTTAAAAAACAGCGVAGPGLRACARCGGQRYCSRECQRKAYADHKASCLAVGKRRQAAAGAWRGAAVLWYEAVYAHQDQHGMQEAMDAFTATVKDAIALNEKGSWLMRRATFVGLLHSDAASVGEDPAAKAKAMDQAETFLAIACRADPSRAREAFVERALNRERSRDLAAAARVAEEAIRSAPQGLNWTDPLQRPGTCWPGLRAQPFWPCEDFAWAAALEDATEFISAELASLLRSSPQWPDVGGDHRESGNEDAHALDRGTWAEWVLFGSGGKPEAAPRTCDLLRRLVPSAVQLADLGAGEIIFSRLEARSAIAPHCASTNTRLTAHLGLVVPAPAETASEHAPGAPSPDGAPGCAIRVGREWRAWTPGKLLFFDDSFEHEVVNETAEERIILLIRFWHPDLPEKDRERALGAVTEASATLQLARSVPPRGLASPHSFGPAQQGLVFGCPECGAQGLYPDLAALRLSTPQLRAQCPACGISLASEVV